MIAVSAPALLAWAVPAHGVSYPSGFEERTLISGLTEPVGVAWAPNGRAFIVEKRGILKTAAPGSQTTTTVLDIRGRVNNNGDRGMLGIAVDSQFASNGYIYVLYTYERLPATPDSTQPMVSQLLRLKLGPDNLPIEERVLLGTHTFERVPGSGQQRRLPAVGQHLALDRDGALRPRRNAVGGLRRRRLVRGRRQPGLPQLRRAQHAGKIMHVDREGQGLEPHSFCPGNTNLDHVCTKLFAKGFRNPFRFTLRPGGGLAVGDVGWGAREEVDLIGTGGRSYGWPCYEGLLRTAGYRDHPSCAQEYAKEGTSQAHVPPDYSWEQGTGDAAVIGGPTYTGDAYPAGYRNTIFVGDYGRRFIKRLVVPPSGPVREEPFATDWFGVDLELAPSGNLAWVDLVHGTVVEAEYSPGNARPTAVLTADPSSGAAPLTVSFDGSSSSDADGDPITYDWDFGDGTPHSSSSEPSHTYTSPGNYTARLTVSDNRGKSHSTTVQISAGNTPPTAHVAGVPYRAGEELTLHGSATDQQDGEPPASAYDWDVRLVHGQHQHFVANSTGTKDITFEPLVDHDANSHYEVVLTVTDSHGVSDTHTAVLQPQTAPLAWTATPAESSCPTGTQC